MFHLRITVLSTYDRNESIVRIFRLFAYNVYTLPNGLFGAYSESDKLARSQRSAVASFYG